MKRTIEHWRKAQFDQVRGAFKSFMAQEKRKEKKAKIRRQII